jgi:hypothetical protein
MLTLNRVQKVNQAGLLAPQHLAPATSMAAFSGTWPCASAPAAFAADEPAYALAMVPASLSRVSACSTGASYKHIEPLHGPAQ